MNGLRAIAPVLGVACGATRPPVPSPSPAAAPVAVAKPAAAAPVAVAKPAEVSKRVIPDTAAGHTMAAWLDAFNSGDAARTKEFVQRYKDPLGFRIVNFREETGGFDLVAIEKSEPSSITFVVEEKASATEEIGWLRGRARRVSVGLRLHARGAGDAGRDRRDGGGEHHGHRAVASRMTGPPRSAPRRERHGLEMRMCDFDGPRTRRTIVVTIIG